MSNLPEPSRNQKEKLDKAGRKNYSAAIRTAIIGGIVSCLLALLAIATLFTEHSDSAGPGFFVLGFLAIAVFIVSGFAAMFMSLASVISYATTPNRNKDSREESIHGVTKAIGFILGIVLVFLLAFKLLQPIW